MIAVVSLAAGAESPRRSETAGVFDKPVVFSLHGSGTDVIQDLATDSDGNIYVAATTNSPDLPVKSAAQPALRGGPSDAFVTKVSPGGREVLWATYLGGSDIDTANFVAVDGVGNVYVAGTTRSVDFPLTVERLGTPDPLVGSPIAFVTKFDRDGKLVYSTVLGGVDWSVNGLAVDHGGNAHLVGNARNGAPDGLAQPNLPVTPGAFQTEPGDGFIAKFGPDGAPAYISYVAGPATSVTIDRQGRALVGSEVGRLIRIDPSGSRTDYSAYLGGEPDVWNGPTAMNTDPDGNVYVAGTTSLAGFPVTTGAYSSGLRSHSCRVNGGPTPAWPPADIFVMKLRAGDLQLVYSALLGGECPSRAQRLLVDAQGVATITGQTLADGYPLRSPELGAVGAACGKSLSGLRNVLSRLGPDGTLVYSSRLCGGAGAALAPDGQLYLTSYSEMLCCGLMYSSASVLRLAVPEPSLISLDRVANAFSGSAFQIAPATLVTVSGTGLGPDPAISLEWNSGDALPVELGGAQVLFDGEPARLLYVSESRILCVTPAGLKGRAIVQATYHGRSSNVMGIETMSRAPALLTRTYPDVGVFNFGRFYAAFPFDTNAIPAGFVVNQDGAWNDAAHPAEPGSIVTLFATGLGATHPPTEPGIPAPDDAAQTGINGYWFLPGGVASIQRASTATGLISAVCQVRVKIPDARSDAGRLVILLLTTSTDFWQGTKYVPFSAWSNPAVIYVRAAN